MVGVVCPWCPESVGHQRFFKGETPTGRAGNKHTPQGVDPYEHPCERGAGLRIAPFGGWRRKKSHGSQEIFRRCVMNHEVQRVSRASEDAFGSLSNCLVEGDPQSEKRARLIKQRAVAISTILQNLVLDGPVL